MTVTVKHSKTNAISDWTQAQLDEQIALGNFAEGTVLADIVLPSDWNNDHTLTGVGTMAEQDANNVAITGGSVNGTTIGATTASTGRFTSVTTPSVTATTDNLTLNSASTGTITINTASANNTFLLVKDDTTAAASTTGLTVLGASSGLGRLALRSNKALYVASGSSNNISFLTNSGAVSEGSTQMLVGHTASAVNYVQVTGAATGSPPIISAQGSDTNIALRLYSKGTNAVSFWTNNGGSRQFQVNHATGTVVNYAQVSGSVTGSVPSFGVDGSDTNISMAFQPKGTGAIDLAAGSSGVNISNGGTVTALTRTNVGAGYTSVPTITISAPTTAGGVQATASVTSMGINLVTIVSGGTGYAVNDEILISGGTFTTQARYRITAVSGGVVTTLTPIVTPNYQALPTNPASTTTAIGTGSGLTLTVNWAVTGQSITDAGSGYIEQPTVTFSASGGSGAAAYATVGSGTVIRSLGNTMDLYAPSGIGFRIGDGGATTAGYWTAFPNTASPSLRAIGSSSGQIATGSAVPIQFLTNATSSSVEQLRVSHTASAVNYVQVTGAATGAIPAITAQGSDANTPLGIWSKNTGSIFFYTSGGSAQFEVSATASAVNRLQATGAIAGSAPKMSSQGTDTNIDLSLTPKGTGLVRFGTYVAGALTATGYINIKAADGTTYKVLVST